MISSSGSILPACSTSEMLPWSCRTLSDPLYSALSTINMNTKYYNNINTTSIDMQDYKPLLLYGSMAVLLSYIITINTIPPCLIMYYIVFVFKEKPERV